jgi:hypothetical protein
MSTADVPATGAAGGALIGEMRFFPNNLPHDFTQGGERWLRTGYMETDPSKFDTEFWRGSIGTYFEAITSPGTVVFEDIAGNNAGVIIAPVATTTTGQFYRSIDNGVTFTGPHNFPTNNLRVRCVIWVQPLGLFVAVGDGGNIYTSPDGINWTTRGSGVATDLYIVHWTGALLVAAGKSSVILTSANGTNWANKSVALSGATKLFLSAASGDGIIVVGSEAGTNNSAVSTDGGATFTLMTIDGSTTAGIYGLIHDGEKFIAQYSGLLRTSVDGKNWVLVKHDALINNKTRISYSDGCYWLGYVTGTFYKSEDLKNWRCIDVDPISAAPSGVVSVKKIGQNYYVIGETQYLYRGNGKPYAGWPNVVSANGQDIKTTGAPCHVRIS